MLYGDNRKKNLQHAVVLLCSFHRLTGVCGSTAAHVLRWWLGDHVCTMPHVNGLLGAQRLALVLSEVSGCC